MKKLAKMKYIILTLLVFFSAISLTYAQQISIDDTKTPEELINTLVEGCVDVQNISSTVNGSINGFSSYGYFEKGNSNFPFENGIVLSSGNVNSAGNTFNTSPLNDGEPNWLTDTDLETALGIENTLNATAIEFNFTSATSNISFNYILASEEYYADYPCSYSDGFAFLIKEAGSAQPYQNIAIIPETTTPVNTNTIHEEIVGFCEAENESFYEGYNIGDTNFNGRTTVMTASTTIIPNIEYSIKLIIADQTDRNFDSAVFIEANSFNNSIDLGEDYSTCNSTSTLNAETNNPQASYEWFLNNNLINGETNNNLTVTSSGNYTVIITIPLNGNACTFQDDINVTLNSVQTLPQQNDFIKCDDISNDGVENFNLTSYNTEIEANLPNSNYVITYHYSYEDAVDGLNATTNANGSVSPLTIYIRIVDNNTGCVQISSVDLIVNPLPIIISPTNKEICSNESGNVTLTDFDSEITNNNLDYNVTYHFSQTDAENGANAISSPYTPANNIEQLFIRVANSITGCTSFTNITLETIPRLNIDNSLQQINACDQDDDGISNFDLTSVIDAVLLSETNVTVTYHVTQEDANNNINPITNPTQFQNTIPFIQTVYIRIKNNNNSCFEIVPIELHANILETGTNIRNFSTCDEAPDDGEATFDLEAITEVIANGLPDVTITYYETQTDLDNNTNAINASVPYLVQNSLQQLFLLIENLDCTNTTAIELTVNNSVTILNDAPVTYCDTDDDGFTAVNLSTFNGIVNENIPNPTVSYFETEANAQANTNALPAIYNNTVNPFVVYVRVANGITGCYGVKPLTVEVLPAPSTNQVSDFVICDNDQDGYSIIDLTSRNNQINTAATTVISYYPTVQDANNSNNEITNSSNYNASTSTVYAKVENSTTGCYALIPVTIIVNTLPNIPTLSNYIVCASEENQTADFILANKDAEILNGQTGKKVLYFETQNNATNNTNSIDKNAVYNNTSQLQTIFVRVENITDASCYDTSSFLLEVSPKPIYNEPQDINACDDNSNDGFETFSLSDKTQEITANSTDTLTVNYYLSLADAQNETNPIQGNSFTNTVNPQELFVTIDNGTYCKGIESFVYNVIQVPVIGDAPNLVQCDTDTDGIVTFDLTQVEIDVVAIRQDNTIINYYANEEDLLSGTNQITNPEAYNNVTTPQTVYIEIFNTISNCGASVSFELIVNLPPVIEDIGTYFACESDTNIIDLNDSAEALLGNQQYVSLTFYSSLADAETAQNQIDTNYNYTTNNNIVFVRAVYNPTGCFSTSSFTIRVSPLPTITLENLEACDDDFDGFLVFDLAALSTSILGNQNPNEFSVNYFETENDAISNINAISNLNYNAENEQELFVRVLNTTTNCFTVGSFYVFVNRKPEVNIDDQVVCVDNLPLVISAETNEPSDAYLWSTGETSSTIDIEEVGDYTVTVTSAFGCTTTSSFNVTASEQAQVDFTVSPAFQDPHTIVVETTSIGNYIYQLNNNEPQESNTFYNVPIGIHYITVIDLNGCGQTPPKRVVVIDAPQFVTPNGDGYFDTWHITGVKDLEGTVVTIFDRYGKILKTLKHNDYGWDGRYNGKLMPGNDYWYVAEVVNGNDKFQVKGHFALRL